MNKKRKASFSSFLNLKHRKKELIKITRFDLYKVMFYRTNLLIHSHRVSWIVKEIIPYAKRAYGNNFDAKKAAILAYIHDDPEIIMGDFQASIKSKMSRYQLSKIKRLEKQAGLKIAKRFPTQIGNYYYKDLLEETSAKKTIESQVVDFADKLDAFGEVLHEIFGGNTSFTQNITNEYGKIPTPFEFYYSLLPKFKQKYPKLKLLLKQNVPIFKKPKMINYRRIARQSNAHTHSSLKEKVGYPHYDWWRKINLKYANQKKLKNLYQQKEYLD